MERKEDKTKRQMRERSKEMMIEQLKRLPIIQLAAEKVNIDRSTHFRWCKEDADYARRSEDAILEGVGFINDGAEAQLMAAIRDRDMRAISLWLRANHPRYKTKVEVSGSVTMKKEMTPEQQADAAEALEHSAQLRAALKKHEPE